MQINVLFVGDVVGRPGRTIVAKALPKLASQYDTHFVIVNGENASGGLGISASVFDELMKCGIDVMTLGDHVWRKRDLVPVLETSDRLVRPANLSEKAVGRGLTIVQADCGASVAVISLLGRVFMDPSDCPFRAAERLVGEAAAQTPVIIVDFHAEATAEKIAMGRFLDGKVSAVLGTHTHVPTADETVLPGGTAYITDVGMTGPHESVIGREVDRVLHKFTTQMPTPFNVATGDVRLSGAVVTIDTQTGMASRIERVQVRESDLD